MSTKNIYHYKKDFAPNNWITFVELALSMPDWYIVTDTYIIEFITNDEPLHV